MGRGPQVNYFLVSQANPYLLPIIAFKRMLPRRLGSLVEAEFKHRCDGQGHMPGAMCLVACDHVWPGAGSHCRLSSLARSDVHNLRRNVRCCRCKQLMEVLPTWLGANRLLKLLNQVGVCACGR